MSVILAGDIGGTKTNLGLFAPGAGRPEALRKRRYESAEWPGLVEIVRDFLGVGGEALSAAAFGIAGPVVLGRVRTPNLAWDVDVREMARALALDRVSLLNDLEAMAEGIPLLRPEEIETLAEGDPGGEGNAALIAPGTGLGMCLIARAGGGWTPLAGEGGHQDFAPRNEREERLRRFVAARHGRASLERIVSGPGLSTVFDFLVESEGRRPAGPLPADPAGDDRSAAISRAALDGGCAVCEEALGIFLSVWGAAAGNLALVGFARAGVWLGGGIAPQVLPALRDGTFLNAFREKGRFREFVSAIPVRVILNPEAALLGAARRAFAG